MLDEVATLFRDLRRVLGKSAVEVAAELGAPTQAIVALEHGHLALLPPWPETARIVRDYTAMAGIDPRPALIVLQAAFAEYESNSAALPRREEGRIASAEWVSEGAAELGWAAPDHPRRVEPVPSHYHDEAYPAATESWTHPQSGNRSAIPTADYQPEPLARLVPYAERAQQAASQPPAYETPHEFNPSRQPVPVSAELKQGQATPDRGAIHRQPGSQPTPQTPSWRKGRSGMPVPAPTSPVASSAASTHQPDAAEQREEGSAWAHFTANLSRARPRFAAPPARIAIYAGLAVGLPVAAAAALSQSAFVAAATTHLPGPVASIIRSSHDFLIHRFASTREGMRWIDVDEPRARRTDKLPAREQSD